ncbi:MAG: glutamine-hydrolyzing carbamoyl-phosphate synthase small subunit [Rhodobacteraceae bacterium]|nr:glutamine-hydrolyzing carbamoyl-phosphate synthase small subunit [Paracoccaceae bacterium]
MAERHFSDEKPTGCIALADGSVFFGTGFGTVGETVGEVCFNTSMTGYQEVSTDPSYAGQIVTFTFPHIGNVGATPEDNESDCPAARGMIVKWHPSEQSNWRATQSLSHWMARRGLIGVGGIDTRRLTRSIRRGGMPHAAIAHQPDGQFEVPKLLALAEGFHGLDGMDLAKEVTTGDGFDWTGRRWQWPAGHRRSTGSEFRIAAIDYGAKRNILRCLTDIGGKVRVFPANAEYEDILDYNPDGIFLSNGPGDPAATGAYAVPLVRRLAQELPLFGICLGHQILALALGATTKKMLHGHHGTNHPVKDMETGKVEITSMNHGFVVDRDTLPNHVVETHISLFDGTNCGLRMRDHPVFSVQFHPEASPGPQDSFYLFERFAALMRARR